MQDKLQEVNSGFGKAVFNRIIRWCNKHRILLDRPGWEQTSDGIMPPPTPDSVLQGTSVFPWRLEITDAENAEVTITPGTIQKPDGVVSSGLTRTGNNVFTVAAGDVITIKLPSSTPTTYSLEKNAGWPVTDDYAVEVTGSPAAFSEQHSLVWSFHATTATGRVKITDGIFAEKCLNYDCIVAHSYQLYDDSNRILAPMLLPGPKVLASS